MPKIVKYIAIAIASLIVLLLIGAAIIAATFDPNAYKPQIIRLVQEKTQRTLAIPGDIKLTFFPKIGGKLGKASITEHNSNTEFASIDGAKVSLALIPLLSKQVVVDKVQIDGLQANIRRFKDGTSNFDDLLSKDKEKPAEQADQSKQQPVRLDIDGIDITNSRILYDDQQQERKIELANLNLETGRIANGVPSKLQLSADVSGDKPAVNARVDVKTGFTMDTVRKQYALKGLDAQVKGRLADFSDLVLKAAGDADLDPEHKRFALDGIQFSISGKQAGRSIEAKFDAPKLAITDKQVSGGKLSGDARMSEGARTINANFSAPSFEGSPQAFKIPSLALDVAIREDKLDAKAKLAAALEGNIDKLLFSSPQLRLTLSGKQSDTALDGELTTPFTADMTAKTISLPKIAAAFRLPNPGGGMLDFKADGNANANLDKQTLAAVLKGKLDQSNFDAKLGLTKFSPAAYNFDIGIDQIDLDRYKRKTAAAAPQTETSKGGAPEQPLDLSALHKLQAEGKLRIGALKAANVRMANVRADLHAANGKADINPLAANLYGGSVAGSLSATASTPPRIAVRQNLSGINIGPLLKDAIGKEQIEGKGNVQLDVTASGATVSQMKKGLNGNTSLSLRDGAVRGVNIAQVIRNAKAKIGALRGNEAPQTGTGSATEKTDFSEFSGSFRITNGVAHNEDLNLKSPLFRIGGAGDINIGESKLDYLVRTTVVSSLQGQGGPELQALKGVTVPVRLSGPFDAIGWRVDFAGLASELAKQKLDERKEELQSKAQKALGDQKGKVQEKLQEQLKGLFRK
ncbi:AsmA family protein [Noviherbaspirillum massiliense]|uniref:AsmA family protein n=1 Tax=Noviherbaspirillum massiliense TaxID=1465823 RepID=UPI0003130479|nr:AsmA family protein [Noviherbaspirillum massiliense]